MLVAANTSSGTAATTVIVNIPGWPATPGTNRRSHALPGEAPRDESRHPDNYPGRLEGSRVAGECRNCQHQKQRDCRDRRHRLAGDVSQRSAELGEYPDYRRDEDEPP